MAGLLFPGQAAGESIYKGIPVEKQFFAKRQALDRFALVMIIEFCLFGYVLIIPESHWRNTQNWLHTES